MQEIFKDIKDYEGIYQVSTLGNVKSFIKYRGTNNRILKGRNNGKGYLTVVLKNRTNKIHRLVAATFIPNPENKPQVNHKNGIKSDNRLENLEWCTESENRLHSFRTGLQAGSRKGKFGKDCPVSKKVLQYDLQNNFIKEWDSTMDVQRDLHIFNSSISACALGKLKTAGKFIWRYK